MFSAEKCSLCGDCFVDCHFMDVDKDTAIQWMEEITDGENSEVLEKCITCYACNERCPEGAGPYDRIAELQHKYHSLFPKEAVEQMETRFSFTRELNSYPTADRVMSLCVLENTHRHLFQGELYDMPKVAGKPYFCWILFSHIGAEGVQRAHAQDLVDRLAMTEAKEVICVHDDCYTMLARDVPEYGIELPFKPIHFSEYLLEYVRENRSRIKPLDTDIAYNRPCASHLTPWKEDTVDELFELIGLNRVKRTYDGLNSMCCGGAKSLLGKGDPKVEQMKNFQDAIDNGARGMVCLCPVCITSFSLPSMETRLPTLFLGDVVRAALGEITLDY